MSTFVPAETVRRITKRKRYAAQRRRLDALGIRYLPAADGEPLVRPEALDGKPARARNGPRWHLLNAQS